MKIAIISDIHANFEALRSFPESCDKLRVVGDLVNFGPKPGEVVDWVRRHAHCVVRGNHDHAVGYGADPSAQSVLDEKLCKLDGTANKARLGANAILGVSLAVARAAAKDRGVPLYAYLRDDAAGYILPTPMLNVLNGGRHADNSVDFQEFMIAPVGAPSFREGLRSAVETFHALKSVLQLKTYSTAVGDEGGFAPELQSNEEAIEFILQAIHKAGYKPGEDIAIMIDPAASEFFEGGTYVFRKSDQSRRAPSEMVALWKEWLQKYPEIWSLEDGLGEEDLAGWQELTKELGDKIQLVGDDNFVTNPELFRQGIQDGIANAILIKLNQIGTVTETLECIALAREHGYGVVISHRSGETDDTSIADLAVATGAGQIKTGFCEPRRTHCQVQPAA